MANKYQYADVIDNDEQVFDVEVIGRAIRVVYPSNMHNLDISWVGDFLSKKGYEYKDTINTQSDLAKDIFVPETEEEE